jgi:raffinose/stachyose/melibiose transport system permease protein
MSTIEARPAEPVEDLVVEAAPARRQRRRRPHARTRIRVPLAPRIIKWLFLGLLALVMLVPMYIMVISAFKSQADIFANPLGFSPGSFSWKYLVKAATSKDFNVIGAYGITVLFVLLVNFFCIVIASPAAYVIARGKRRWHVALLLFFVSWLFIPSQVTLIPVVYVLRVLGLIGTIPGFVLFDTAGTLPITIFLFAAYIRTLPREIDEAAALDGAGRIRAFWSCIFPMMKPVVGTILVLNSVAIWNDWINPQIILGPSSGIHTVTTGVFAAVGQYQTDYTTVFPTLLLAIAPVMIFFVIMQRHIIGGLVAGATKG